MYNPVLSWVAFVILAVYPLYYTVNESCHDYVAFNHETVVCFALCSPFLQGVVILDTCFVGIPRWLGN